MQSLVRKEANDALDRLELAMLERFPPMKEALNHVFCKGLYIRECVMETGMIVTSKIHKERHPYFVMSGVADVWRDGVGWERVVAPYFGITEPGTRRVLKIIERTNWVTVHSNSDDGEDLEIIEERIIEKHENPLLESQQKIS